MSGTGEPAHTLIRCIRRRRYFTRAPGAT